MYYLPYYRRSFVGKLILNNTVEQYLPFVAAIIVGVVTAFVNYRLGNYKNKTEVKALSNSESEALRDDILALVSKYEAREKQYEEREARLNNTLEKREETNQQLRGLVETLRLEVNALRIENQSLTAELHFVRAELEKFDRKVFYIGPKDTQENKT